MKAAILGNVVITTTYSICVTYAAIYFNKPSVLWWYLLLTVIGFTYKRGGKDDANT